MAKVDSKTGKAEYQGGVEALSPPGEPKLRRRQTPGTAPGQIHLGRPWPNDLSRRLRAADGLGGVCVGGHIRASSNLVKPSL